MLMLVLASGTTSTAATNMKWRIIHRNFSFFDKVNRNWEAAWSQNITPWETGTVSKPLQIEFELNSFPNLLQKNSTSRALVPGCGSGYDCEYLLNKGFNEVIGLDLSPTAIKKCQNTFSHYQPNLKFECGNFFESENGKFNFIFDYLFFSALEPSMRINWGNSIKNLLEPKNGILFTLIFPHIPGAADKGNGPPYPVDPEDYQKVLEPHGIKLIRLEKCTTSIKPRMGKELIGIWKFHEK